MLPHGLSNSLLQAAPHRLLPQIIHIAPTKIIAALFTAMPFPPPLPSIVCATVFVICKLNNRTAQVPKGRSTGKERAQINK